MIILGFVLIVISIIVLISRESIVDSIESRQKKKEIYNEFRFLYKKCMEKRIRMTNTKIIIEKSLRPGSSALGFIGLILLLAGLIKQEP
jgi:hypothetical protein